MSSLNPYDRLLAINAMFVLFAMTYNYMPVLDMCKNGSMSPCLARGERQGPNFAMGFAQARDKENIDHISLCMDQCWRYGAYPAVQGDSCHACR